MTDQEATSLCEQAACPDHRREEGPGERFLAYTIHSWNEGEIVSVLVPTIGLAPLVQEIGWVTEDHPLVVYLP